MPGNFPPEPRAAGCTSLASISRVLSRPLGKKGRRDFDMLGFYQKERSDFTMENGPLTRPFFTTTHSDFTIQHGDFTMKNWELSDKNWLQGGATKQQLGWFTTMRLW